MSEKVKTALIWLKGILESNHVHYQIVGGLAAHIHGGTRPVADIDLYIPKEEVKRLLPLVSQFISKPLSHYVEEGWDLEYLQLIYQGQKIEIGLSPGTKIKSSNSGSWVELPTDFSKSVLKSYLGVVLPTMPVAELVEYKRILGRPVDLIDIDELTGN